MADRNENKVEGEQAGSLRRAMQKLHILLVVLLMMSRLESVPDELNSMKSQPMTLRVPRQTFVQLTNLDWFGRDTKLDSVVGDKGERSSDHLLENGE